MDSTDYYSMSQLDVGTANASRKWAVNLHANKVLDDRDTPERGHEGACLFVCCLAQRNIVGSVAADNVGSGNNCLDNSSAAASLYYADYPLRRMHYFAATVDMVDFAGP